MAKLVVILKVLILLTLSFSSASFCEKIMQHWRSDFFCITKMKQLALIFRDFDECLELQLN